jgi:hypothetical protein
MSTTNLTTANLANFYGSEKFFFNPFFNAIRYTEGVQFVSANGAAWLITDILAVALGNAKVKREEFLTVEFNAFDKGGILTMDDGNGKVVYRKNYGYTDFPLRSIKFFLTDGVLMLASEY